MKITIDRDLVEQALEALERLYNDTEIMVTRDQHRVMKGAITTLRAALTESEKIMNNRVRELEKESGVDVYRLGLDRIKWEGKLEKYTELVIQECCSVLLKCKDEPFPFDPEYACRLLKDHFKNG